jgi:4,5-DOPA dioxygenase extradiol
MKEDIPPQRMPVLFIGHGSPMNAIENNEFSSSWKELGTKIPYPKAILCISAHWETAGTCVTSSNQPSTIHDFGGFPEKLFAVQYPAPGSHRLAASIICMVKKAKICRDDRRGLDHGCWSVLVNMYPKADVPVVQLSLDYTQPFPYHYELAKELMPLRDQGILILATGNVVHNLRMISWNNGAPKEGYDWAVEVNDKVKKAVKENDVHSLINIRSNGRPYELAIPSPEHFLPLLYIMGLKEKDDSAEIFNDKVVMGSLAMTSFAFGL